jgi:hypothetical protein
VATIADNIEVMARLVAKVKRETRLSETSILRIVDMNFALAQQGQSSQGFAPGEPLPFEMPEEGVAEGQLIMFPESDAETAEALGITPAEEV